MSVMDRGDLFDPECPTRVILDRLGDKWSVLVVEVLARDGRLRFGELREAMGGVSAKVLTSTLRSLTADGLVERIAYGEVPPRVEYSLTDLGMSLQAPLDLLKEWAEVHAGRIVENRAAASA